MISTTKHYCRISFIGICLILMTALPAVAVDDDPLAEGRERYLNGHGFLPSLHVDDPFVSSTFQTHVGGGMAIGLKTPFTDLDDNELYVLEGDLVAASLGLGYQQKFGQKWAVGIKLAALVRAGTSAESFLTEGADLNREGNLWAMYRLKRSDKCQLTVGLEWSYSQVIFFTPKEFARHIALGGSVEDAPLSSKKRFGPPGLRPTGPAAFRRYSA